MATALGFGGVAAQTGEYCQFGGTAFHCFSTYELSSDALALRLGCTFATNQFTTDVAPGAGTPQTVTFQGCPLGPDGNLDVGGVLYDGGLSPNHQRNGGSPDRDLPLGVFQETVYINDVVFGQNVGGFYCTDADGDRLCGEPNTEGEFAVLFCGHTEIPGAIDTSKFFYSAYYVVGPLFQGRDCPHGGNPVGGTFGSLSIWLTPLPPEQPPGEEPPGGEAEYGVWGGGSNG